MENEILKIKRDEFEELKLALETGVLTPLEASIEFKNIQKEILNRLHKDPLYKIALKNSQH